MVFLRLAQTLRLNLDAHDGHNGNLFERRDYFYRPLFVYSVGFRMTTQPAAMGLVRVLGSIGQNCAGIGYVSIYTALREGRLGFDRSQFT